MRIRADGVLFPPTVNKRRKGRIEWPRLPLSLSLFLRSKHYIRCLVCRPFFPHPGNNGNHVAEVISLRSRLFGGHEKKQPPRSLQGSEFSRTRGNLTSRTSPVWIVPFLLIKKDIPGSRADYKIDPRTHTWHKKIDNSIKFSVFSVKILAAEWWRNIIDWMCNGCNPFEYDSWRDDCKVNFASCIAFN